MKKAIEEIKSFLQGELNVIEVYKKNVGIDWRLAEAELKAEVYKKCISVLEKRWEISQET